MAGRAVSKDAAQYRGVRHGRRIERLSGDRPNRAGPSGYRRLVSSNSKPTIRGRSAIGDAETNAGCEWRRRPGGDRRVGSRHRSLRRRIAPVAAVHLARGNSGRRTLARGAHDLPPGRAEGGRAQANAGGRDFSGPRRLSESPGGFAVRVSPFHERDGRTSRRALGSRRLDRSVPRRVAQTSAVGQCRLNWLDRIAANRGWHWQAKSASVVGLGGTESPRVQPRQRRPVNSRG